MRYFMALANYFVEMAAESISSHGQFSVALSGGNSPKKLYELLASPALKIKLNGTKFISFLAMSAMCRIPISTAIT